MAHTAKTPKKPGFSPFLTLFHPLSTPGQAWPKYPPQQGINGPLHSYLTPFGTPGQKGQKVVILDPLFDPFLALLALLARRAQYCGSHSVKMAHYTHIWPPLQKGSKRGQKPVILDPLFGPLFGPFGTPGQTGPVPCVLVRVNGPLQPYLATPAKGGQKGGPK